MLVFKKDVFGFIYDSQIGNVIHIFRTPLNDEAIDSYVKNLGEDEFMFTDIEEARDMFDIESKEQLDNDGEGLNNVFDFK